MKTGAQGQTMRLSVWERAPLCDRVHGTLPFDWYQADTG